MGEAEFAELARQLAPVSESYLRALVRSSGLPLDPVVEGVRQESFEQLGRTLEALAREYALASAAGDRERARRCREAVLIGRQHARLAARRRGLSAAERARKEEMAAWMLLWLENPAVFPAWLAVRRRAGSPPP